MNCPPLGYKESIDSPPDYIIATKNIKRRRKKRSKSKKKRLKCLVCNGSCKCQKCKLTGFTWEYFKGTYLDFISYIDYRLTHNDLIKIYEYKNYSLNNAPPSFFSFTINYKTKIKNYRYLGNNNLIRINNSRLLPKDDNDRWAILRQCSVCNRTLICNSCNGRGWKYES